ncbi:hypothetical protein COT78_02005 [Candidatus Berkelbacteria bacterium CG10_big_fil_rev_8_21_14_0_10_43_13]|uniref:Methyltransferase domain-containing protein n=1 Tax=Candidatus Berkelbacteria bacterium CG10_big_fil_rev_8_21_14_0_10_43_13 TaxID=1974514 RepID=A0A2H0W6L6_9BACT|nr:MAG: hypothetical protein COT78_02005 [Candidatus Berkelbacteria bacterium CG10_big_fil_rev_8_21_14_0_10_43_13]
MHTFLYFIVYIILLFLLWIIFWQSSLLIAAVTGSPIVYSNPIAIRDSLHLAKLKKGEMVVDLGCGSGRALIVAAREFGAKGIGVDRSLFCVLKARLNVYLAGQSGNIKIYRKSFETAEREIKQADVIYLYLLPSTLEQIEQWFFDVVPAKSRVVSLAFEFVAHKSAAEDKTITLGKETKARLYLK